MQIVNGITYLTADEALARRLVTKAEHERWIHGGLTKKQHDRMIAMALETSRQSAQHRVQFTACTAGTQKSIPLQMSLFVEESPAKSSGN